MLIHRGWQTMASGSSLPTVFIKHVFWNKPRSFIYDLSPMAAFVLQPPTWVAGAETVWPEQLKTFTIWPFTDKVCQHLVAMMVMYKACGVKNSSEDWREFPSPEKCFCISTPTPPYSFMKFTVKNFWCQFWINQQKQKQSQLLKTKWSKCVLWCRIWKIIAIPEVIDIFSYVIFQGVL